MTKKHVGYELFMLALSIFVLIVLFLTYLPKLDPEIKGILRVTDDVVCIIFLGDFLYHFFTAKSKLEYMKWGWLDLLSSIPMMEMGRFARITRILRIIRLLRGIRSARYIVKYISKNKAMSMMYSMMFILITMITIGAICILHFERAGNSNISTAEDAIWWAFVTVTTVGYGDYYPVTTGGRVIASALMLVGIGLFGSYTGYMASWFTSADHAESSAAEEDDET